ncbi:MAG: hypothetical protein A3D94_02435 [Alphaproteobacteria bacterium RIFCSPHIGHO2_12_FULL_66_14]|nr:MAG: hypothetical protein A3D94_02435 [Alphaproteobacteria bacterium RIFCSPHIGHO2_12_FULL_66_14]
MWGLLALAVAALFTGAAFYINFAEQPARLGLDGRSLVAQWKTAYARGFTMQASLAVVGFLLGVAAWWTTRDELWLAGAAVLIANWPYTLLVIMPVNRQLEAVAAGKEETDGRALVVKWGGLHARRTMLGAAATLLFLWAAV